MSYYVALSINIVLSLHSLYKMIYWYTIHMPTDYRQPSYLSLDCTCSVNAECGTCDEVKEYEMNETKTDKIQSCACSLLNCCRVSCTGHHANTPSRKSVYRRKTRKGCITTLTRVPTNIISRTLLWRFTRWRVVSLALVHWFCDFRRTKDVCIRIRDWYAREISTCPRHGCMKRVLLVLVTITRRNISQAFSSLCVLRSLARCETVKLISCLHPFSLSLDER